MGLKRAILLICVLMLGFALKDLTVPRECLEAWVDQWLSIRTRMARTSDSPDQL